MSFQIDPANLAKVRDDALLAAKKSNSSNFIVLAAVADEILQSYKLPPDQKELFRKKHKIVVS